MNKRKQAALCKMAIAFYVLAALALIGGILVTYNVTIYIQGLLAGGSLTWGANWLDVILYYVNNTMIYFGIAALLMGVGYIIALLTKSLITTCDHDPIGENEESIVEVCHDDKEENQ